MAHGLILDFHHGVWAACKLDARCASSGQMAWEVAGDPGIQLPVHGEIPPGRASDLLGIDRD